MERSAAEILQDKVKLLLCLREHKENDVLILTNPDVTVWQWQSRQCWNKKSLNQKSNQAANLKNFDSLEKVKLIMEDITDLLAQFIHQLCMGIIIFSV